ncbi:hypothetical protein CRUP_020183, partial [Coryphaenoides rupestris]
VELGEGQKEKNQLSFLSTESSRSQRPCTGAKTIDPSLRDCPLDCKVYVGNLGNNGNKTELERAFGYYGPLRSVWVARNPPGFAFVENMCGCRVRVELSNGEKRSRSRGPPPSWSRRPRDDYRRRSPPVRRSYPLNKPTQHFISNIRITRQSLCNSPSLTFSLASLCHFYLVQIPPKYRSRSNDRK